MSAVDQRFMIFRFYNPDGSSKDWGIRDNGDGTYTKCWGKTGRRLQTKDFSLPIASGIISREINAKTTGGGYRYVGTYPIGEDGKLVEEESSGTDTAKPEATCIYWRIKVSTVIAKTHLELFRSMVSVYADTLLEADPGCVWVLAFKRRYPDIGSIKAEAGSLSKEDGIGSLLLLMALKKAEVKGISILLSHEDGVEIGHQIKLETKALAFFDSDFEHLREISEKIGLVGKRLDLSRLESKVGELFF